MNKLEKWIIEEALISEEYALYGSDTIHIDDLELGFDDSIQEILSADQKYNLALFVHLKDSKNFLDETSISKNFDLDITPPEVSLYKEQNPFLTHKNIYIKDFVPPYIHFAEELTYRYVSIKIDDFEEYLRGFSIDRFNKSSIHKNIV